MASPLPSLASFFPSNHNPPSLTTASLPGSKLIFSSFPPKLSRNKKWVSRRNRFYPAKPTDHDLDTTGPSPQASTQNAGNASTSYLSILCPLLRLFSVSLFISFLKQKNFELVMPIKSHLKYYSALLYGIKDKQLINYMFLYFQLHLVNISGKHNLMLNIISTIIL